MLGPVRVHPIFGQTAARQSLQSRNSAQQLFLMQHLKAVRALAPLSTSCTSPSSPQKMGHTHQQLAASTFHLILVQFSQEQREADAVQTRGGQCGQRWNSRFRTRSTSGWRVEADGLALSGVAHGGERGQSPGCRAGRPRHLESIALQLCADDSAINNLPPRVFQRAKG